MEAGKEGSQHGTPGASNGAHRNRMDIPTRGVGRKGREPKENRVAGEKNFALNVLGHSPECTHAQCAAQWQEEHLWAP